MPLATHAVLLTLSITAAVFAARVPLRQQDLTIAVILFMSLFVLKRISLPNNRIWHSIESILFTFIAVFIVMATGKAASPFFFLLYFLLFSLSLMLEPAISLATTFVLVIVLISQLQPNASFQTMLPIFSLAFLTPFAMLLGQEYTQMQQLMKKEETEYKELSHLKKELTHSLSTLEKKIDSLPATKDNAELQRHISIMQKTIESPTETV